MNNRKLCRGGGASTTAIRTAPCVRARTPWSVITQRPSESTVSALIAVGHWPFMSASAHNPGNSGAAPFPVPPDPSPRPPSRVFSDTANDVTPRPRVKPSSASEPLTRRPSEAARARPPTRALRRKPLVHVGHDAAVAARRPHACKHARDGAARHGAGAGGVRTHAVSVWLNAKYAS